MYFRLLVVDILHLCLHLWWLDLKTRFSPRRVSVPLHEAGVLTYIENALNSVEFPGSLNSLMKMVTRLSTKPRMRVWLSIFKHQYIRLLHFLGDFTPLFPLVLLEPRRCSCPTAACWGTWTGSAGACWCPEVDTLDISSVVKYASRPRQDAILSWINISLSVNLASPDVSPLKSPVGYNDTHSCMVGSAKVCHAFGKFCPQKWPMVISPKLATQPCC